MDLIIYYRCHHQNKKLIQILSGKPLIDIRDAKIARKCYPDFDGFDVNRKLVIRIWKNRNIA